MAGTRPRRWSPVRVTKVDPAPYLERLGVKRPSGPSLEALRALQLAHIECVPFENADVLAGRPIQLVASALVDRLTAPGTRRGGFCYQLNGAFAALLAALGFQVDLLAARFHGDDRMEPRFGHLALQVTIDREPWLVDVGAGYSFRAPLRLEVGREQDDPSGTFRIQRPDDGPVPRAPDDDAGALDVAWRHRDGVFRPHYRFEPAARRLDEFAWTCEWTRTSPDSPFTQGWICAVGTPGGWATLDGRRLRVTGSGQEPIDRELSDDEGLAATLARWFGVAPPAPA